MPHGFHRLLSEVPMFSASTVRFVSSSSSLDPASADPTGSLRSNRLPAQGRLVMVVGGARPPNADIAAPGPAADPPCPFGPPPLQPPH